MSWMRSVRHCAMRAQKASPKTSRKVGDNPAGSKAYYTLLARQLNVAGNEIPKEGKKLPHLPS